MGKHGMVAAALVTLILAGCTGVDSRGAKDDRLAASKRLVIPDVPVPDGFKMDLKFSDWRNSSGGLRTGYALYTGRASLPALVEFYKDNMPISGWAMIDESGTSGSYILRYEKGSEKVDVKVTPGGIYTDIMVSFWPRGSTKK